MAEADQDRREGRDALQQLEQRMQEAREQLQERREVSDRKISIAKLVRRKGVRATAARPGL